MPVVSLPAVDVQYAQGKPPVPSKRTKPTAASMALADEAGILSIAVAHDIKVVGYEEHSVEHINQILEDKDDDDRVAHLLEYITSMGIYQEEINRQVVPILSNLLTDIGKVQDASETYSERAQSLEERVGALEEKVSQVLAGQSEIITLLRSIQAAPVVSKAPQDIRRISEAKASTTGGEPSAGAAQVDSSKPAGSGATSARNALADQLARYRAKQGAKGEKHQE